MVSFALQKHLYLIRSHLFIFAFISFASGDRFKSDDLEGWYGEGGGFGMGNTCMPVADSC